MFQAIDTIRLELLADHGVGLELQPVHGGGILREIRQTAGAQRRVGRGDELHLRKLAAELAHDLPLPAWMKSFSISSITTIAETCPAIKSGR
jgi:hypothetical protein